MVAFDAFDRMNACTIAARAGTISEEAWCDALDDLFNEGFEPLVAVSEVVGPAAQGRRNPILPRAATCVWGIAVPGEPRKGFPGWLGRSIILW
jgi:hypothetical protein